MKKSVLGLMTVMALGACGTQGGVDQGTTPAQSDADLFAGFEVNGKSWDAVGSLGIEIEGYGYFGGLCTATLIGPNTVLSAKHCSQGLFAVYGEMFWAPGSENAQQPTKKYKLVESWLANPLGGGSIGLGADVSVFFLDDSVTEVTPIPPSADALGDKDIDRLFYAIGYGTQNNAQDAGSEPPNGRRKLGKLSLNAIKGQKFELLFGSYEAYLQNLIEIAPTVFGFDMNDCLADATCAQTVQDLYATPLYEGYDAFLGMRQGEAQVCHGDSGGPLVGVVSDSGSTPNGAPVKKRLVYGVASNVWFAANQACYGNFYATFGPEVQPWLQQALAWVDPCGDLDSNGRCDGTVANRCTSIGEGARRLASVDCAELDQECVIDSNGLAGCQDPAAPAAADSANPAPAPAPGEARASVAKSFTGMNSPAAQALESFKKQ